jgi:hypothetical protein
VVETSQSGIDHGGGGGGGVIIRRTTGGWDMPVSIGVLQPWKVPHGGSNCVLLCFC